MKDHLNESTKHVIDGLSLVTVLGALVELLPAVAATRSSCMAVRNLTLLN
jgi:hypothetical protein